MDAGTCPECGRPVPRPSTRDPHCRRRRWIRRAVVAACVLVAGAAVICYRDALAVHLCPAWCLTHLVGNDQFADWAWKILSEKYDRLLAAEEPRMRARRQEIREELKRMGANGWAGEHRFRCPCGATAELLLAPHAGYVWAGSCERNHGEIAEVTEDRIVLSPVLKWRPADPCECPEPTELVRVHWGGEELLVRPEDMFDWCQDVNAGPDEFELVGGLNPRWKVLPEVPEQYRQFVLREPIKANLVEVCLVLVRPGEEKYSPYADFYRVQQTLPVGTRDGVFKGLWFYASDGTSNRGVVLEVDETSCIAVVWYVGGDEIELPTVGTEYSTRRHPELLDDAGFSTTSAPVSEGLRS